MNQNSKDHIVFFDGVCNLCNASVRFIIKYDKKRIFLFSPLQSDFASKTLGPDQKIETLVYKEESYIYLMSTAALKIARHLKYYRYLYFLIYIPRPFRDYIYKWIAKHRYRIFGRQEHCMIPGKEISNRFIVQ